MTDLERVERALDERFDLGLAGTSSKAVAAAVIEALAEPSDVMVEAACKEWTAAIDEAAHRVGTSWNGRISRQAKEGLRAALRAAMLAALGRVE